MAFAGKIWTVKKIGPHPQIPTHDLYSWIYNKSGKEHIKARDTETNRWTKLIEIIIAKNYFVIKVYVNAHYESKDPNDSFQAEAYLTGTIRKDQVPNNNAELMMKVWLGFLWDKVEAEFFLSPNMEWTESIIGSVVPWERGIDAPPYDEKQEYDSDWEFEASFDFRGKFMRVSSRLVLIDERELYR